MKFLSLGFALLALSSCRSAPPAATGSTESSASKPADALDTAHRPAPLEPVTEPSISAAARPAATSSTSVTEPEFRALHELETTVPAPQRGETVDLGGAKAYLSLPVTLGPGLPSVLLVHEWWGLNANIEHWADRFAAEGYAALAVDLYDGVVVASREEATRLATSVSEARMLSILASGERFLRGDARTRAPRVAAIGWGFGGHYALLHATASKELAGVVVYYGSPVMESEKLAAMQAQLLGIFGMHDKSISPDAVVGFEAALTAVGRKFKLCRYDAEHAFANPSSARYSEALAREAWNETRSFLERVLKSP